MALKGRVQRFYSGRANGRNRREAVAAVRPSGGLLIGLTPAAHPLGREPLKMPRSCSSSAARPTAREVPEVEIHSRLIAVLSGVTGAMT